MKSQFGYRKSFKSELFGGESCVSLTTQPSSKQNVRLFCYSFIYLLPRYGTRSTVALNPTDHRRTGLTAGAEKGHRGHYSLGPLNSSQCLKLPVRDAIQIVLPRNLKREWSRNNKRYLKPVHVTKSQTPSWEGCLSLS
jgi:hypothetical protein